MVKLVSFKVTMPIGGFSFEYKKSKLSIFSDPSQAEKNLEYFAKSFKISNITTTHEPGCTRITFQIKNQITLADLIYFIEKYQFPAMGFALGADSNIYCLDGDERGKKLTPDDPRITYLKKNKFFEI
ncbi:MAG: hypothetical protein ACTSYB_07665 [Candidatus Helarchaeota archaeon]